MVGGGGNRKVIPCSGSQVVCKSVHKTFDWNTWAQNQQVGMRLGPIYTTMRLCASACVCVCTVVWNSCHIVCGKRGKRTLKKPRPFFLRLLLLRGSLLLLLPLPLLLLCLGIIRRHAHYNMYHNGIKGAFKQPLTEVYLFFSSFYLFICIPLQWVFSLCYDVCKAFKEILSDLLKCIQLWYNNSISTQAFRFFNI